MGESQVARLRAIAGEVADFAAEEARQSQLPGLDQGPGDAHRHLVGVAELSRRLGPARAYAIAEGNELRSFGAMLRSVATGQPFAPSHTLAVRRMDRHTNKLALWIGARADSRSQATSRASAARKAGSKARV